jgi:hypothetical protein
VLDHGFLGAFLYKGHFRSTPSREGWKIKRTNEKNEDCPDCHTKEVTIAEHEK